MIVKVSSKYQVVIPEEVRNALGIKAGSHMEVVSKGKIAFLVPVQSLEEIQNELEGKVNNRELRNKKERKL